MWDLGHSCVCLSERSGDTRRKRRGHASGHISWRCCHYQTVLGRSIGQELAFTRVAPVWAWKL